MTSYFASIRSPHFTPALLFVNTCGSFLVLVALSTRVGSATGSGLLAGAVLSAPWLPALLLAAPLNRLLSRYAPEGLVRLAEAASLLVTAAALVVPGRALLVAAVCLVVVRGFFEAVTRSATSVVLRNTVPAQRLDQANTVAEICKLTGLSIGAALAGPAASVLSLRGLFLVNAAVLALSALLAWALPSSPAAVAGAGAGKDAGSPAGADAGARTRLRVEDPVVRRLFARFLLVAFWQGFHTVAVTVIPLHLLGGGTRLVGVFVAVSAVAIFAGSLAALPAQRYLAGVPSTTWTLLPMAPLLLAVAVGRTVPTIVLYALFLVLFEMAFVHYNNRLLASASDEELPSVVTLRATLLPSGVAVSILVMGALADLAGPLPAALVVAAVTVLVTAATATTRQGPRRTAAWRARAHAGVRGKRAAGPAR
ncbi:MFS transporter [Streptomyces sp. NBC_00525]|uniref:MFS transporter n=1 Tax=Streptomyces sp. NBC_00525 TaxID=2903660 RepID=UPI002E7FD06C|nr:MFS transporter [Streptomyces sp. NBC_00525]WUC98063.1 MFS transporter [Streptomyces sp. NBC_00525]